MIGSPTAAAAKPPFDAVIFDLDGVVTNTALVHQAAWKDAFERILHDPRVPADANRAPLSRADYLTFIDGMPREEGVVRFLAARGVKVEKGKETDEAGAWTGFGLGAWKNEYFLQHLRDDGVQSYPGTLELLQRLAGAAVPTAVVTSSRNASLVLQAAGIHDLFQAVMDGTTAAGLGLRGKPAPDVFLEAASRLGVAPAHAVVVEDSAAGVEAGRRGGFGLVVGIDRTGNRRQLEAAGAGIVLNDVGELDLGQVIGNAWHLVYEGFDAAHEGHREALTTLGNGYMGVRGAAPEGGPFSRTNTTRGTLAGTNQAWTIMPTPTSWPRGSAPRRRASCPSSMAASVPGSWNASVSPMRKQPGGRTWEARCTSPFTVTASSASSKATGI